MDKKLRRRKKAVRRVKRTQLKKQRILLGAGVLGLVSLMVVGGLFVYFQTMHPSTLLEEEVEALETVKEEALSEEESYEEIGEAVLSHIFEAIKAVENNYKERPEEVELTEENQSSFVSVDSCLIGQGSQVVVTASCDKLPKSDDKYYYLFALSTFETEIKEDAQPLAKIHKNTEFSMDTPLNYNSSSSKLFKKFVVAVKKEDRYIPVSRSGYITNPEMIAKHPKVFQTPESKKGILVDPSRLRGSELTDLGTKQAAYNIPLGRLLGATTNPAYPTISYNYNGKTYSINGQAVAEFDIVFGNLTAKGITTTAIVLNDYGAYQQMIHPKSRVRGAAPYYMFNAAENEGIDMLAAAVSFLADRYSGSAHGVISNWVVANEVNARKEWNYMEKLDVVSYTEEYVRAFRVFYNAVKSVAGDARIYISLDQQWDRNLKNNHDYDGRDVLDAFNDSMRKHGNIDWGIAQHPYNVPLTTTATWAPTKYVKHSADTSIISMQNIEVLVNYMHQEQFLTDRGEVRSIMLTEQGYTSSKGEANQAAAFCYAYYKVAHYDDIDGFLLNRQTDAAVEVNQGLAFGINGLDGHRKQMYDAFKYADTAQWEEHFAFALSIIGISSWGSIMY